MTNVLVLGANGHLARNTTRVFLRDTDATLTLYLRRASRLRNPDSKRVTVVEGDVLDGPSVLEVSPVGLGCMNLAWGLAHRSTGRTRSG